MKVVFVGRVPEHYAKVLRKFGFEISESFPPEDSALVVFYEDCKTAEKTGYTCFSEEELKRFIELLPFLGGS